jgi:HSP20 family protein
MDDTKKDSRNIFMELAKVKSQPTPITVAAEPDSISEAVDIDDEMEGQLTVDVYQDPDNIIVQSTVAGVDPDDLEINITNESITIHGKRERKETIQEKDYFYQECFWGRFSRSIILPAEVDSERSVASLKNGVLTVKMPKLERRKAKKLKVKID